MEKKNNFVKVVLPCLFTIVAIALFSTWVQKHLTSDQVVLLNKGWNVQIDKEKYHKVNLEDFHFGVLSRGDTLIMTTTLPEYTGSKCLTAQNQRAWLEVYVGEDENPLFSFGKNEYERGEMIASGYMWVELPESASGQKLTMVYHVLRNNAFSSVWVPRLGNTVSIVRDTYGSVAAQIWLCLFFIMLGLLMIVISLPFCFKYREVHRFLYIGIFGVLTGIWVLTYNYAIDVVSPNYMMNTYIEYVCLYLMPIPLLIFFIEIVEGKWKKHLFGSMAIIDFVFCTIALFLQWNHIVAFWDSLNPFHLLVVIELLAGVLLLLRTFREKELENQYLLLGFLIVLVTALWDVGLYRIQRFLGTGAAFMKLWNLTYSLMVMILCMIISSMIHLFERIKLKNTEEVLERLAYQDSLTGLYNRAKITECVDEIDRSQERDYALISMDLNSLKYYNDTKGHEHGDRYLCCFAQCLSSFWKGKGITGRIGGDEFIVLLPHTKQDAAEQLMEQFLQVLSQENERQADLKMETAYGIAYGQEDQAENVREAYRLADARMYEMKRGMKNARVSHE